MQNSKTLIIGMLVMFFVFQERFILAREDHIEIISESEVENAISKGSHKDLAEYYRKKAQEQMEIAAMHQRMAKEYRGTHANRDKMKMAKHCKLLQSQALKMADEYTKMSEMELSNQ